MIAEKIDFFYLKNIMHKFVKGDRFEQVDHLGAKTGKFGTVGSLRDDKYERDNNWPKNHYYYSVTYDDGSFETYLNGEYILSVL